MGELTRTIRHELGYRALRGLLAGGRALPLAVLRRAGALAGALAARLAPRECARARAHLELAFPAASQAWREAVLQATARHLGRVLGEVAWLWSVPPHELLARTSLEGLEHMAGCQATGRGVVIVTGHCGNWEWLNLALGAAGVPLTVAAREVYDRRLDEVAQRLRGRFGGETELRGPTAARRLYAALRRGRSIGLLVDQDIDAPGVFVEFFGRPAWTPVGAAVLALRAGVPAVPVFATRLADGRMRVRLEAPVAPISTGDLDRDAGVLTARLTARIEAQIRAHPEQWVWMHRRWLRQPGPGEPVFRADEPEAVAATPG